MWKDIEMESGERGENDMEPEANNKIQNNIMIIKIIIKCEIYAKMCLWLICHFIVKYSCYVLNAQMALNDVFGDFKL